LRLVCSWWFRDQRKKLCAMMPDPMRRRLLAYAAAQPDPRKAAEAKKALA
jgi:hypothetical protein